MSGRDYLAATAMQDSTPKFIPAEIVRTLHCNDVAQFLNTLSPRGALFAGYPPKTLLFRGHSDDDKCQLVPSALRNNSHQLLQYGTWTYDSAAPDMNRRQIMWEIRVLAEFFAVADAIGLALPEDTQTLRRIFDDHWIEPLQRWPPPELLSLMALAQHHHLPTRLLDWTRHHLKAAHFAAYEPAQEKSPQGRLSVWVFDLIQRDLGRGFGAPKLPFTIITAPAATNPNLRAQEGVFTVGEPIENDDLFVDRRPFDQMLGELCAQRSIGSSMPWFYRITLPKSEARELSAELGKEGITRATLFPDFYGVVEALKEARLWYSQRT